MTTQAVFIPRYDATDKALLVPAYQGQVPAPVLSAATVTAIMTTTVTPRVTITF